MPAKRKRRFKPLSLVEFQARFATEEDCARFLFEKRWPNGWFCPRCGADKYYPIKRRKLFECARCQYQASVIAGTVMQGTRTPLRLWFLAIFLMGTDKRGLSSVGLAGRLGISQKRAWYILHKLRKAMSERNGRYKLDGRVELDESFFGAPKEGGSRRRCAAKHRVLAGLSFTPEGNPLHLRLQVLPGLGREHLAPAIERMVASGAIVRTNGLRSYLMLGEQGYWHERVIASRRETSEELSWMRTIVSNAMALIAGTHHGLGRDGKHLQAYLDEFCYRFSRRHRPDTIFERCVSAVAACPVWTYRDITGRKRVRRNAKLKAA